jgi:hypothetical protein
MIFIVSTQEFLEKMLQTNTYSKRNVLLVHIVFAILGPIDQYLRQK